MASSSSAPLPTAPTVEDGNHVTLELRIARLFSHTEMAKLILENDEPWQLAFRVFVERNWALCLDTWTRAQAEPNADAPQIRLNEPIVNFPMDGRQGGRVTWYNRDLSSYIQVIPRSTIPEHVVSEDPREWMMDRVVIQHVDPEPSLAAAESADRGNSVVSFDVSIPDEDRYAAMPTDQMSIETFGTAQTATAESQSMQTAATHSSDANEALSTVMACMILSCLLQYTPELFGILSPYCFTVLRRYIFPEVISMVHHGAIDLISDSGIAIHEVDEVPEHHKGFRSFVEFDRGKLESCFDEWLSVGGLKRDKSSPSNPGHFHRDGRSAGIIVSGARGVGKTMFCRALIRCLVDMAPWTVTVLYRQREVGTFYDGVYFLDELSTAAENHLLQVHPLSLGSQYASEASPRGIRRIIKLFRDFKEVAEPGKIVITLIDNMDNITKTLQAHSVFTQLRTEAENAGFEFFILGTNNSAALPNFDSIDSTRNLFRVNNFRTMKVYSMPLHRAFDFLLRHVQHPPRLAFPKSVLDEVRRCGNSLTASRHSNIWTPFELRMHNLNISDMRKISLHVNLDLAQRIMQRQQSRALPSIGGGSESETPLAPLSNTECQRMLYASLERVFNATPTLTGLSPNAVVVLPWLRHDLSPFFGVEKAADEIYQRCTYQRQYIQFVRVITSDEYENEREFEEKAKKGKYGHVTIPQRSITSLLHHLHKRFMFRQSYLLESPEQLLPFHPKLSAHIPRFNLNPIDHFYWQHRDSLLVMNSLESLVTYHEEVERKCLAVNEKERIQQKTTANDFESARMVEAGLGMDMSWSQTLTNATANTEAMTAGRKTGTAGEVNSEIRPLEFEFGIPEVKGTVRKAWQVCTSDIQLGFHLLM